eukprot:9252-Heterococcus_DN1.PRE.3
MLYKHVCALDAHMIRLLTHSPMFPLCKHTHEFNAAVHFALHAASSFMVLFSLSAIPTYHAQQLGDKAEQLMANRQLLEKQPNRKGMSTALQVDDTIMKLLL